MPAIGDTSVEAYHQFPRPKLPPKLACDELGTCDPDEKAAALFRSSCRCREEAAHLLDDGQHKRERCEGEEDAKGQKGCAPSERRLSALEDDHVRRVRNLIVIRLEVTDDVASELARRPASDGRGSGHLVRLAHHLGFDGALDQRVDARERDYVKNEHEVVRELRVALVRERGKLHKTFEHQQSKKRA